MADELFLWLVKLFLLLDLVVAEGPPSPEVVEENGVEEGAGTEEAIADGPVTGSVTPVDDVESVACRIKK